jgi:Pyruvate/2-oxoacid:ferredoxin oxidoreductase delta subunit
MREGNAYFRPVIAAVLSAITDALDMVGWFFADGTHDNVPFFKCLSCAYRCPDARLKGRCDKADMQGRLAVHLDPCISACICQTRIHQGR